MPEESEVKQVQPPEGHEPNPEDAELTINEETVKNLAQLVGEEHLSLFQQDLAQAISNAQQEMESARPAVPDLSGGERDARGNLPDNLTKEEAGEIIRCSMGMVLGRPGIAKPRQAFQGAARDRITQALNPDTDATGAVLMPTGFVAEVEQRANEPAVFWPLVNKSTTKNFPVTMPEITSYPDPNTGSDAKGNSATTPTEVTVTEPNYSDLTWNARDVDARVPVKIDLLNESPINIYDHLVDLLGDQFNRKREYLLVNGGGSGSDEPYGFMGATVNSDGDTITSSDFDPDDDGNDVSDLLEYVAELPKRYRGQARIYMGSTSLFNILATLAENVKSAQFILDKIPPVDDSEHLAEGQAICGDFRYFKVKHSHTFQLIESIAAERKTREMVFSDRWDAMITLTDAFRKASDVDYS